MDELIISEDGNQLSVKYLLGILIDQIVQRPIKETRSQASPDKVLSGYLQMSQALLDMCPP